jgi:hypothetical protein
MANVAHLVRAPGCGSGGRGFNPLHSPQVLIIFKRLLNRSLFVILAGMNTRYLQYILLILTFLGVLIPYVAFIPFVAKHGLDIPLVIEQAGANRIAAFAWLDVLISAIALLITAFSNNFIRPKQAGIVALLTLLAGVSAGLPLFLYFATVPSKQIVNNQS